MSGCIDESVKQISNNASTRMLEKATTEDFHAYTIRKLYNKVSTTSDVEVAQCKG